MMDYDIFVSENKLKMYISGILIFVIAAISILLFSLILIQMNILEYRILLKILIYLLLFFVFMPLYIFFRPRHFIKINDKNILLIYGKHFRHIKQDFLLADLSQIKIVNKLLYEKIKICSPKSCINIRSSEYNKTDYELVKKWAINYHEKLKKKARN